MDINEKIKLVKEVGEEIISEEELVELFKKKKHPVAYDGFEPSGRIHIAQGLLRSINVNKLTKAGIKFKFWVADWFGMLNHKMGGDLDKIRIVGEYFIEVWKACGMDLENVEFIWTSEFIKEHPEYWETVLKLSMNATIQRVMRCGQIMGRSESTGNPSSQIFYPLMQAADIHHLGADIAQLGMDQRKVNMLARDIFPKLGFVPPVAVHHHMLMGLTEPLPVSDKELKLIKDQKIEFEGYEFILHQVRDLCINGSFSKKEVSIKVGKVGEDKPYEQLVVLVGEHCNENNLGVDLFYNGYNEPIHEFQFHSTSDAAIAKKMSKSNPNSAIFMTDSTDEIKKKFNKAYCPEGQVEDNPVLEYFKYIVFEKFDKVVIERPGKFGGNLEFNSYEELENSFSEKKIHPLDLKNTCAKYIDELILPIRKHFETDKKAKELLKKVNSFYE